MGAYVSTGECLSHYNITLNCSYFVTKSTPTIGGYQREEVPTDPDIAGVGIIWTFIAVTSFSLLLSILHIVKNFWKNFSSKPSETASEERDEGVGKRFALKRLGFNRFGLTELFEELVLGCSDTQVITGGAYAITLRYFKGCTIKAYHYDIVGNMLLLTCATHLMSVTVVRNYWVYPWLGVVRVLACLGVFIVTGLLLANQNAPSSQPFPGSVPPDSDLNSPIFLPAACFQSENSQLFDALHSSFGDNSANAFLSSKPGNRIPGWNNYLFILLWYCVAFIVDVIRFFRRGKDKEYGKRAKLLSCISLGPGINKNASQLEVHELEPQTSKPRVRVIFRKIMPWVLTAYLMGGIGISGWTVVTSTLYIGSLRSWARKSGWLKLEEGGHSAEDDPTSFGQLVPIFSNIILVFTVAQLLSNKGATKRGDRKFDRFGDLLPKIEDIKEKTGAVSPTVLPVSPTSPHIPLDQSGYPATAQFDPAGVGVQQYYPASHPQIGQVGPAEGGSSYFPSPPNAAQQA